MAQQAAQVRQQDMAARGEERKGSRAIQAATGRTEAATRVRAMKHLLVPRNAQLNKPLQSAPEFGASQPSKRSMTIRDVKKQPQGYFNDHRAESQLRWRRCHGINENYARRLLHDLSLENSCLSRSTDRGRPVCSEKLVLGGNKYD